MTLLLVWHEGQMDKLGRIQGGGREQATTPSAGGSASALERERHKVGISFLVETSCGSVSLLVSATWLVTGISDTLAN